MTKKLLPLLLCLLLSSLSVIAKIADPLPFITRWNLATAGSGATQLSFGVFTSGTVNYSWTTVPAGTSGSGTFSGSTATLTGLPTGATIDLSISPTNFRGIGIGFGTDKSRLLDVKQWGDVAWTSIAFSGCDNLNITATDVPNLASVTNMSQMFRGCSSLNGPTNIGSWNTAAVTNMSIMFLDAGSFNQPIGSWNTAAVTNMSNMFRRAAAFNQPLGDWNTAAVIDMSYMFYQATAFNQPLGSWNTAAVTSMSFMFGVASSFNQPLGSWNTAKVTDMYAMFSRASSFNQPLGSWNTAKVTDMGNMFNSTNSFNQPLGSWNTAAVMSMFGMFWGASSFNQPLGSWNTAAVVNMGSMFRGATAFNQSLAAWGTKLNPNVNLGSFLDNCGMSVANYDATLTGFNAGTVTGRSIGAAGLKYCASVADRNNLVLATASGGKGWTITGDALFMTTAFAVTGGGSYCQGGTGVAIGLSNSETGVAYQLKNGASAVGSPVFGTGSSISFGSQTAAGTYIVVAISATGGCTTDMTGSVSVSITYPFSALASSVACSGGSLRLSTTLFPLGAHKWQGPDGFSSNLSKPTVNNMSQAKAGVYAVSVTYNNCISLASVSVNVPAPQTASVSSNSPVCVGSSIRLTANTVGDSYQWKGPKSFNSSLKTPSVAATNTTQSGVYSLTVTGSTGCFSTATASVRVQVCTATRIAGEESESIEMEVNTYPNPTSKHLTVEVKLAKSSTLKLQLYNATGNTLNEWELSEESTSHRKEIDLSVYKDGLYLIQAQSKDSKQTKRVVKIQD